MLKRRRKDQRGQSLVEFLMLMPIILTFLWYLVHVSLAINKSIVGQKHARSQLFLKLWNHRSGPVNKDFNTSDRAHFYVGVSDDVTIQNSKPKAPVESLGIGATPKKMADAFDEPGEPTPNALRQNIRVRTVVGICTHRKTNPSGVGLTDFCGSEAEGN
jgi:hypothetical protein